MKKIKKIAALALCLLCFSCGIVFIFDYMITKKAEPRIYSNINDVPKYKAGLLLGTSKYLRDGSLNLFFEHRIDAAVLLLNEKKIEYIIASGDNRAKSYNEPQRMKEELMKRGVPSGKIYLDFAGFRTLDSVVRCKEIFGQDEFLIISQRFHNERAVFIALSLGINAFAFNASGVLITTAPKTRLREYFARVKAVIDVYVTGKDPKYLGEKIKIPQSL